MSGDRLAAGCQAGPDAEHTHLVDAINVSANGTGGDWLIDVSMRGVRADPVKQPAVGLVRGGQGWTARHSDLVESARLP
jgi:hypothetical protein